MIREATDACAILERKLAHIDTRNGDEPLCLSEQRFYNLSHDLMCDRVVNA